MAAVAGPWAVNAATLTRAESETIRACLKAEMPVTKRMVKEALAAGALKTDPLQGGLRVKALDGEGLAEADITVFDRSMELSAADKGTAREITSAALAIAQARDAAAEDPWRAAERIATVMRVFRCIEEAGVVVPRQAWPKVPAGLEAAAAEVAAAVREAEESLVERPPPRDLACGREACLEDAPETERRRGSATSHGDPGL